MQINVYSSMLSTIKLINKMKLFFAFPLLRSLHIVVLGFFWLQALCIESAKGQELFPPSFNFLLDEQLFLQSDMRTNGFHTVTCTATHINFASPSKVDTVESHFFEANERYEISSYIGKDIQHQTTDSCFFFYLPNDEVVKTCKFFVKANSGDFSKDTMWARYAIRYKEKKMLSKKTINYLVGLSRVAFEKTDTFFYQKGLLYKSISYWKGFEKDIQVDSIITNYSYDSLNNLKSLLVLPSVNFIKNFPPQKYNTHSLKVNYFFRYDADTIIHTKFNYYDYLPADSFAIDIYKSIKIIDSCGFLVEQISSKRSDECYIHFKEENSDSVLEYDLGEVKNTIYVENTKLPRVVYFADRFGLKLYHFTYQ